MSSFGNMEQEEFTDAMTADQFRVVPVTDDLPVREDMAWVLAYMEEKRAGRPFCSRADVSPAALGRYLPCITLLDPLFDASGKVVDARYRLMGTEISSLYGEATGELISSYHGEQVLARVCQIADYCVTSGAPALGLSKALSGGSLSVDVSVLYVPLSTDGETVNQFFIYSALERRPVARF